MNTRNLDIYLIIDGFITDTPNKARKSIQDCKIFSWLVKSVYLAYNIQ